MKRTGCDVLSFWQTVFKVSEEQVYKLCLQRTAFVIVTAMIISNLTRKQNIFASSNAIQSFKRQYKIVGIKV
jgi:hypothetical protein